MDQIAYGTSLLKIIVMVQIVFSSWGYLTPPGGFLMPASYGYTHILLLLFGALSISKPKSADNILMYLMMNVFTILNDIILLSLFQPVADAQIEERPNAVVTVNTYRFVLGMSIVNLILKPFICFLLYKIYQTRGGDVLEELSRLRVCGDGRPYNGYNSVDDSSNIETAAPHQNIED